MTLRLTRRDLLFIAVCLGVAAVSAGVVLRYFSTAFPETVIDFRYDRNSSRALAERIAVTSGLQLDGMHHAVRFDSDDQTRIFLERSLGLEETNRVLASEVRVWHWRHRWFRPLEREEVSVDVAPGGQITGYRHVIPEERALPSSRIPPQSLAAGFLASAGVDIRSLQLVEQSQRRLPRRTQFLFTWESRSVRPAGAPYRFAVTVDGNLVSSYSQALEVPEAWSRSYRELRSKNAAAGAFDRVLLGATMIAALLVFVARLRRGDLQLRFLAGLGIASVLLVGGVAINSIPSELAFYDTTASWGAFLGQLGLVTIVQCFGVAMMLIVVCGAGESLYRERLPRQLAIPRLWSPRALRSRKVFLGLVLGYSLVPLFMAYQVIFYLTAHRFGAWSPAEVPYDDILNSALPWFAVLFAGFFPAFSEEFLSRAFSIPLYQRLVRSRWTAIVIAGLVWGFGHADYPNQPFWIRGVEVGLAGIAAGVLMDRFGLLPLLVWHYTIDAVYTAALLFTSGNPYYIVTAAFASLVFALPLAAAVVLYVRHHGFAPDDDLTNAALPTPPLPPLDEPAPAAPAVLPPAIPVTRRRLIICAAAVAIGVLAFLLRPPSPLDAIDYRMTATAAKNLAAAHVGRTGLQYVAAVRVEGFRSWDPDSPREEGGAPGGFDEVAAAHLLRQGLPVEGLVDLFTGGVEAATWMVRFFTPMTKQELFVEVDPRSARVIGYHKYQDERRPGMNLPQAAAIQIARRSFVTYGLDAAGFELKESLTFLQPNRRDWLFHFQEQLPVAADTWRRVTVRVAGAEVTQFNKTIHIPESVRRAADEQTLLNVILFTLKIAGIVALVAITVTGLVVASRMNRLPWRRALRWTLVLSLVPIAGFAARYEAMLFGYATASAWEAFRVSLLTAFLREVGIQAGILFLAIAGLEAVIPHALDGWKREARFRFGRSAVVAAVTAIATLVAADAAGGWMTQLVPAAASVDFSVPEAVGWTLPGVIALGQAALAAVAFPAMIALYTAGLRRRAAATITVAALFCAFLDPLASGGLETILMASRAAAAAAMLWILGRHVLGTNPLAWPSAAFMAAALSSADVLFSNRRPDLLANGLLVLAVLAIVLWWLAAASPDRRRVV